MFAPITVKEIELTDDLPPVQLKDGYRSCRMLVRLNRSPQGWVTVNKTDSAFISAERVQHAVIDQLGIKIFKEVIKNSFIKNNEVGSSTEPISIVVCTRNRAKELDSCIKALSALDYPDYEIIIVDNAPSNDETFKLVASLPVRYVQEERPGLDWARNRGIAEAKYNIIAFTDDDAQVDRYWLQAIVKNFSNPEVMSVSGFVAPFELETFSQQIFELNYGGMGHGFIKKIISRGSSNERQLLWASSFGIGANMAFRKSVFSKIGTFDLSLDVGTPSSGGGDIDIFHRVVSQGFTLVYDPDVIVWHTHRREFPSLRKQITDNGRGFGCYLIKCFIERSVRRRTVISFLIYDWFYNWNLKNIIRSKRSIPRTLSLSELKGMLISPFAYAASKKYTRKIATDFKHSSTSLNFQ